jgi:hypothetical protein
MPEDTPIEAGSPVVRYTAKELFGQINHKLDALLEQVQGKASKEDLDKLDTRVARIENRLGSLEDTRRGATSTWKLIAAVTASTVGVLIALTGIVTLIWTLAGIHA